MGFPFLDLKDEGNISTLDGVTYDTLIGWMKEGMTRYMDSRLLFQT